MEQKENKHNNDQVLVKKAPKCFQNFSFLNHFWMFWTKRVSIAFIYVYCRNGCHSKSCGLDG